MIDVKSPTCEHPGCKTQPNYNNPGETKGRFCTNHKEAGMIDVKSPTCEHPGCKTRPNYNFVGEKKGRFCSTHKEAGMINVKDPTCEHPVCKTQPNYNNPGEKNGRFCTIHKEPGMIDVKHLTCEHPGCNTRPNYNFTGEKNGRFCSTHKEPDMINVVSLKCKFEDCEKIPYRTKYDGYCTHCFSNLFPNDPRTAEIRTKTHEIKWVNALILSFPDLDWVWDQPIYVDFSGGCCATKRRIDLRVLLENQVLYWLCIEIDENQHKKYADTDNYEISRYNDLFVDFSGHYIFVRINPDPYWANQERVDPPFEERLNIVCNKIHSVLEKGPVDQDLIEIHHLFYDELS